MIEKLLLGPGIWLLKALVYWIVFRLRSIQVTALNCLVIAGAGFLLMFLPVPMASVAGTVLSLGLAILLTVYYTEVPFLPNGLFIPLGIECAFACGLWLVRLLL